IPHEAPQSASLVNWAHDPNSSLYNAADATPLYIIAVDDYVTKSGDLAYARARWEALWKAYQFLRSTYNAEGVPRNDGVGPGWVEGGPLVPIGSELYQSALGAQSLRSLAELARFIGKADVAAQLDHEWAVQHEL